MRFLEEGLTVFEEILGDLIFLVLWALLATLIFIAIVCPERYHGFSEIPEIVRQGYEYINN